MVVHPAWEGDWKAGSFRGKIKSKGGKAGGREEAGLEKAPERAGFVESASAILGDGRG